MNFYHRVYTLAKKIPRGKVASYGQIATLLGNPRSARAVGYALRALPETNEVPWWRVINRRGELSIQNMGHPAEEQAQRLRQDGVLVKNEAHRFTVNIKKYQWRPAD